MSLQRMSLVGSVVGALLAVPSFAELALLKGGHTLKIVEYEVGERTAKLTLENGGSMTVPLLNVIRILDDEIVESVEVSELPSSNPSWSFTEGQTVPDTPFGELIFDVSKKRGLNPEIVAAVVQVESSFRAEVVSAKGARGLMQLMPATAERFGVAVEELGNPRRNLEAGTGYLDWLRRRFDGDLTLALAAYNAGEGSVDRYDGVPPYRETQNYLKKIYRLLGIATDS